MLTGTYIGMLLWIFCLYDFVSTAYSTEDTGDLWIDFKMNWSTFPIITNKSLVISFYWQKCINRKIRTWNVDDVYAMNSQKWKTNFLSIKKKYMPLATQPGNRIKFDQSRFKCRVRKSLVICKCNDHPLVQWWLPFLTLYYAYFKIEPRLRTPEYGIKFLRADKVVYSLTPMSRRC